MTQEALAEAAGVEARYLQDVERGRANLSIDVLVSLATALDIEAKALLHGTRAPDPARTGRPKKRK